MRSMMLCGMHRVTLHFTITVICSSSTIYIWLWPLAKGGGGDPFLKDVAMKIFQVDEDAG